MLPLEDADADAVYQTTEQRTLNKSQTKAHSSLFSWTSSHQRHINLWRARIERMARPRIEFVELTGFFGELFHWQPHLLARSSIYYYPNQCLLFRGAAAAAVSVVCSFVC